MVVIFSRFLSLEFSTGEYEFRCNACHLSIAHDLHKKCNSLNNERVETHSFIDNVLFGYACVQCKYIQLSKEKLRNHLDKEHQQINTNDEQILEIPLLKTSTMYIEDTSNDDKLNDKQLMDAMQRVRETNAGSDENDDGIGPTVVAIDEDEPTIDLTLSDDDDM